MKRFFKKVLARLFNAEIRRGLTIPIDVRQVRNIRYLSRLYSLTKNVPGTVVECGIGKGRTFLELVAISLIEKDGRTFWGFDSFGGFPEPHEEDRGIRNPKKGELNEITREMLNSMLIRAGATSLWIEEKSKIIEGFFSDSLKRYDGKPIAFLHIDADLYESYRDVLRALFPFVSKGGVVLFDEYGEKQWPGATKAVDEFLSANHQNLLLDAESGKRFLIVK